jgi:tryptophanase
MSQVKFFYGSDAPLEMHKVRIVQKPHPPPVERRLEPFPKRATTRFTQKSRYLSGYAHG